MNMDFELMEFTKIAKTLRGEPDADATYRIGQKGIGRLKFTRKGTDKLEDLIGADYKGLFNLYVNKETQSLAFEFSERGRFKFSGLTRKSPTPILSYNDLSKTLTKNMLYMIVESKKYSFILVPIDLLNNSEAQAPVIVEAQPTVVVEAQPPVVEAEKAEQPASSTESSSPAKKGKGKKK